MKSETINQEEATMPRHQFDTTEYEFAHGRAPKGRGSWAFFPEGSDTSDVSNAVFAPAGTFTEARRWVRQNCEPGVWRVGS